jgi:hypothetical protein
VPVQLTQAIEMIRPATGRASGTWADLGSGSGLFSRALAALLADRGRVIAVDRDARALGTLERHGPFPAPIETAVADVRLPDEIAALRGVRLDGVVLANLLHFLADPTQTLLRLVPMLVPDAPVVVVEYDRERANRWVPHPLPPSRLRRVALGAGLSAPEVVARRPSAYQGRMYCARMVAPADGGEEA